MMSSKNYDLVILLPVYNDWESLNSLLIDLEKTLPVSHKLLIVVDDSSLVPMDTRILNNFKSDLCLLELKSNLGHQKAIAIGLSFINDNIQAKNIIVMDADGEDNPIDIKLLIKKSTTFEGIIFAHRKISNKTLLFSFFYQLYKLSFRFLTGKRISFGNFSLVPYSLLNKLVNVSDIWNHYACAVIRSKLPHATVPTKRGKRYFGISKMNTISLFLHGFSAFSVYSDYLIIRLLISTIILIILSLLFALLTVGIKLFTNIVIPGLAIPAILVFMIILFQAFFMGMIFLFLFISNRAKRNVIPSIDYEEYLKEQTFYSLKPFQQKWREQVLDNTIL